MKIGLAVDKNNKVVALQFSDDQGGLSSGVLLTKESAMHLAHQLVGAAEQIGDIRVARILPPDGKNGV